MEATKKCFNSYDMKNQKLTKLSANLLASDVDIFVMESRDGFKMEEGPVHELWLSSIGLFGNLSIPDFIFPSLEEIALGPPRNGRIDIWND